MREKRRGAQCAGKTLRDSFVNHEGKFETEKENVHAGNLGCLTGSRLRPFWDSHRLQATAVSSVPPAQLLYVVVSCGDERHKFRGERDHTMCKTWASGPLQLTCKCLVAVPQQTM